MPIKYTAARFQIKFNTFAFACGGRWGKVTETSWEDKMWFKLRTKTIFGDNSRFSNVKLIWNLIDICVLVSSEECTRVLEHVYSESMMRCDGTAEIENAHLKTFHLFSPRSSFYPDVSKYAASIPVHLYSHPDIFPPSSPLLSIYSPTYESCMSSFCLLLSGQFVSQQDASYLYLTINPVLYLQPPDQLTLPVVIEAH